MQVMNLEYNIPALTFLKCSPCSILSRVNTQLEDSTILPVQCYVTGKTGQVTVFNLRIQVDKGIQTFLLPLLLVSILLLVFFLLFNRQGS